MCEGVRTQGWGEEEICFCLLIHSNLETRRVNITHLQSFCEPAARKQHCRGARRVLFPGLKTRPEDSTTKINKDKTEII